MEKLEPARLENLLKTKVELLRERLTTVDTSEGLWLVGHCFDASASPKPSTKKGPVPSTSAGHEGQYQAKYIKFEWILHAAFVVDAIMWGVFFKPVCICL